MAGSVAGLSWSLRMLVVGFLSVAPWIAAAALIWLLARRFKRKKQDPASK